MTVLVTGGAGYIGSHMVFALADAGERVDHVAADIAGAARDQDCHVGQPYSQSVNTTLGDGGLQPTGATAASARRVAAKTSPGSMSRTQR